MWNLKSSFVNLFLQLFNPPLLLPDLCSTPRNVRFAAEGMRRHLKMGLQSQTGEIPLFPTTETVTKSKGYRETQRVRLYCFCQMPFEEEEDEEVPDRYGAFIICRCLMIFDKEGKIVMYSFLIKSFLRIWRFKTHVSIYNRCISSNHQEAWGGGGGRVRFLFIHAIIGYVTGNYVPFISHFSFQFQLILISF